MSPSKADARCRLLYVVDEVQSRSSRISSQSRLDLEIDRDGGDGGGGGAAGVAAELQDNGRRQGTARLQFRVGALPVVK